MTAQEKARAELLKQLAEVQDLLKGCNSEISESMLKSRLFSAREIITVIIKQMQGWT